MIGTFASMQLLRTRGSRACLAGCGRRTVPGSAFALHVLYTYAPFGTTTYRRADNGAARLFGSFYLTPHLRATPSRIPYLICRYAPTIP